MGAEVRQKATEMATRASDPTTAASIRLAGAAGLLGCALGVAGGIVLDLLDAPATTASAAEIVESVKGDRTALLVGMLLSTAAVSLWLVFGAGVWLRLRRATGPESLASVCFAFGFVAFVTLLLSGFTAFFVLVYRDAEVGDPRLLYDLAFGLLAMSGAPTAIALGSYAAGLPLHCPAPVDRVARTSRSPGSHCASRLLPGLGGLLLSRRPSHHRSPRNAVHMDHRHRHCDARHKH